MILSQREWDILELEAQNSVQEVDEEYGRIFRGQRIGREMQETFDASTDTERREIDAEIYAGA